MKHIIASIIAVVMGVSYNNPKKAGDLNAATTPLSGAEIFAMEQNGHTVRATAADIANCVSGVTLLSDDDPTDSYLQFDSTVLFTGQPEDWPVNWYGVGIEDGYMYWTSNGLTLSANYYRNTFGAITHVPGTGPGGSNGYWQIQIYGKGGESLYNCISTTNDSPSPFNAVWNDQTVGLAKPVLGFNPGTGGLLAQEMIVNSQDVWKCVRVSPAKWVRLTVPPSQ